MINSKDVLLVIRSLHPLAPSAVKLAKLCSTPDVELDDVIEIVAYDQALTTRVLSAANSSAFSGTMPVTTISQALMRVGTGVIVSLAVGSQLRRDLETTMPDYGLSEGEIWRHSVASSLAAERMIPVAKKRIPPAAVTAALMHDIGKLVIAGLLDSDLSELFAESTKIKGSFPECERSVLGFSHEDAGALLAREWGLPDELIEGIEHHHEPGEGMICNVVHLSNLVAKAVGAGLGKEGMNLSALQSAGDVVGLDESGFELVCAEVASDLEEVLERYQ